MDYTPENIDIAAFEEALKQSREFQRTGLYRKVDAERAFFEGYSKCVDEVISMLHCSNYEKSGDSK